MSERWQGHAVVYGPAQGMGSKRLGRNIKTGAPMILDDNRPELRSWQGEMKEAMRRVRPPVPLDTAVAVSILVYVARPRGHYGAGRNAGQLKPTAPCVPPAGRDIDKIARAVLDCATASGWVVDDRRVAWLGVARWWDDGEGERVEVRAQALDAPLLPVPMC